MRFFLGSLIIWQSHETKKTHSSIMWIAAKWSFASSVTWANTPQKSNLIGIKEWWGLGTFIYLTPFKHGGAFFGLSRIVSWAMGFHCGFMLVQGAIEGPTGMLQCWHYKKWCFPKAWRRAFHSAALGFRTPRKMSETTPKNVLRLCRCWSPWSVQWISCLKMVIDKEHRLASPFKMEKRLS